MQDAEPDDAPDAPKPATRPRATKGRPPAPKDTLGALQADPPKPMKAPKAKAIPAAAKPAKAKPSKERTEPLNFRVTPDFRRAFKRAAAAEDCKKVELLERIFAAWSARQGAG